MKVLVIGNGGREHAIIWKLNQSPDVKEIFCAPGNPGIGKIAKNVDIDPDDIQKLVEFSREINIDLTIVGPEAPLVEGIVEVFQESGLKIIGPSSHAAQLEGSKSFAKAFLKKYKIPTALSHEVTDLAEGKSILSNYTFPVVIKADGLAGGKGVFICQSEGEAIEQLRLLLEENVLGKAGQRVVIEEFLEGIEVSILCFVDGKTIKPMISSQDHKQIFEGNRGPNTGGMGTCAPNLLYTEEIAKRVEKEILMPTLGGIQAEEMDYRGIIFVGIMLTNEGPKVLEYNVRFGDPETQVVLPCLKTDLLSIFLHVESGRLGELEIQWQDAYALCVVLASKGYPEDYEKNKEITGIEKIEDEILLFHSGTVEREGKLYTNGGRVLGVTVVAENQKVAQKKVYENIDKIHYHGKTYRRDIGQVIL
ncbi:phosphoribosylamine--glycine ligase [Alkaliphilus metalliredigens QYMF]|uniref:Phosphoribosylamine--glycine ligase n=1 Tax=Alkaliphilus metalliredigens (strain QYMF) TaxID=293826 RepID=A6TLS8_ALKMQ|nr:phosphoribosylamine--glycine ligase [Alkaliphilus metalliredigens]ABR47146.1 phosphoribosylamine--glycine ligase [Alkaliphilus metalliredigens QYMF]